MKSRAIVIALAAATGLAACAKTGGWMNRRAGLVAEPTTCADQTVPIYFADDSAELTQPALLLVADTAQRLRGCRVLDAEVVGLAGAPGSPQANLELSRRRAERVTRALLDEGLPTPTVDWTAVGETGAVTPVGEEPMRRRAEIRIRARPS